MLRPVPELVGTHEDYEVETTQAQTTILEYKLFGEVAKIPCKGSNIGTKFGLRECKRGRCKTLRERPSRENGKRVDEGIHQLHLEGEGLANETWAKLGWLYACQNVVLSNNGNKTYHFVVQNCSLGWWDLVLVLQYACPLCSGRTTHRWSPYVRPWRGLTGY